MRLCRHTHSLTDDRQEGQRQPQCPRYIVHLHIRLHTCTHREHPLTGDWGREGWGGGGTDVLDAFLVIRVVLGSSLWVHAWKRPVSCDSGGVCVYVRRQ